MAAAPPILHDSAAFARVKAAVALGWLGFVLLMLSIGVQEELRDGRPPMVWRRLVEETTSLGVATLIAWRLWRWVSRLDHWLDRPLRWLAGPLAWAVPISLLFVGVVYALRYAIFELGGVTYRHPPWAQIVLYESLKFLLFYALFTGVAFGLRSYLAWNAERLRAEAEQALSKEAQLLQLAQQLQPHFLFNALNTVSSLIHTDPDRADALLTRLARLLRAASDVAQRPQQTLADELALLEAYAEIMVERFGDRARIEWQIDPSTRDCRVPTLGLQPLLENCFRHAVERRSALTTIVLRAERAGDRLRVEVDDDGGRLAEPPVPGVGLSNLQRRLQVLHGDAASLRLAARDGGGVRATVELPCGC